jgi:hypothetical protein
MPQAKPQTLLDRLTSIEATIQALKSDPGPSVRNSRTITRDIIKQLEQEAEAIREMANASPVMFRALHEILNAAQQTDCSLWKEAVSNAQHAIALVQKEAA